MRATITIPADAAAIAIDLAGQAHMSLSGILVEALKQLVASGDPDSILATITKPEDQLPLDHQEAC